MGTSVGALEGGISALIIIQHWLPHFTNGTYLPLSS